MASLKDDLADLLNRHSRENRSNTPDFLLAQFLMYSLNAFECISKAREDWYGHRHIPGGPDEPGQDSQLNLGDGDG